MSVKQRLPSTAPDGTQVADATGNVFQFDAETKAWIAKGVITPAPLVGEAQDGQVYPQLFDRIRLVDGNQDYLKDLCKIAHDGGPGYFYVLHSSDDLLRFRPESRTRIRLEVDSGRLHQRVLRNVCVGGKGDRGAKGPSGRDGRPAARERAQKPQELTADRMVLQSSLALPLDTDVSLRLYRNSRLRTTILFALPTGSGTMEVKEIQGDPVTVESVDWADNVFHATLLGSFGAGSWRFKVHQRGPQGSTGPDGSSFLTVQEQLLDSGPLVAGEAIKGLRRTESGGLRYIREAVNKEICTGGLRATGPQTKLDVGVPWAAAQVTAQDCKYIGLNLFEPNVYTPDLNLPEWTPTKACADRERFDTAKFEWQDQVETELPFSILKDPRPEEKCCQQPMFFCPNVGDACPVEGRVPPPKRLIEKTNCPCECEPEKIELKVKCQTGCKDDQKCALQPCAINGLAQKFEALVTLEPPDSEACTAGNVTVKVKLKFPTDKCKDALAEFLARGGNPKSPCDVVVTTEIIATTGDVIPTRGEVIPSTPDSLLARLGKEVFVTKEECLSDLTKGNLADSRMLSTVDGTFRATTISAPPGGDFEIPLGLQGTQGTATIEIIVNKDKNECCLGFDLEVCASVPCTQKSSGGSGQSSGRSSGRSSGASSGGSSSTTPCVPCTEQPCTGAYPEFTYCRKSATATKTQGGVPDWIYGRATYVRGGRIVPTPDRLPDRLETLFSLDMINDAAQEVTKDCREACVTNPPADGMDVYTFVSFGRMNRSVDELEEICCAGCVGMKYPGTIPQEDGRVICFVRHFTAEEFRLPIQAVPPAKSQEVLDAETALATQQAVVDAAKAALLAEQIKLGQLNAELAAAQAAFEAATDDKPAKGDAVKGLEAQVQQQAVVVGNAEFAVIKAEADLNHARAVLNNVEQQQGQTPTFVCPPPRIGMKYKACKPCVPTGAREIGYVPFAAEIIANVADANRKKDYDDPTIYVKASQEVAPRPVALPARLETHYEVEIDGTLDAVDIIPQLRELCKPDRKAGEKVPIYTFVHLFLKNNVLTKNSMPLTVREVLFTNKWAVEFKIGGPYEFVICFVDEAEPKVCEPPQNGVRGCSCTYQPDPKTHYLQVPAPLGKTSFAGQFGDVGDVVGFKPLPDDMFVMLYDNKEVIELRRTICCKTDLYSGNISSAYRIKNVATTNEKLKITVSISILNTAGTAIDTKTAEHILLPGAEDVGGFTHAVPFDKFDECGMRGIFSATAVIYDCCVAAGFPSPAEVIQAPATGRLNSCDANPLNGRFTVCIPKNPPPDKSCGFIDPPITVPSEYYISLNINWHKVMQSATDDRIKGPTYPSDNGPYARLATTPIVQMAGESHPILPFTPPDFACCPAGQLGGGGIAPFCQSCTGTRAEGDDIVNDYTDPQVEQDCQSRMTFCFRPQPIRNPITIIAAEINNADIPVPPVMRLFFAGGVPPFVIGDWLKVASNPDQATKNGYYSLLGQYSRGEIPALPNDVRLYFEIQGIWKILDIRCNACPNPPISIFMPPGATGYVDVDVLNPDLVVLQDPVINGTMERSNDCCDVVFKISSRCRPISPRFHGEFQFGRNLPNIERCEGGPLFTSDPFGTGIRDVMAVFSQAGHLWDNHIGEIYQTADQKWHLRKSRCFKEFGNKYDILFHDCECPPPPPPPGSSSSSSSSSGPWWPPAPLRRGYCVKVDVKGSVWNIDTIKAGYETGLPFPFPQMIVVDSWPAEKTGGPLPIRNVLPRLKEEQEFHLTFSHCECDLPPAGWLGDSCKVGSEVTARFWTSFEPLTFVDADLETCVQAADANATPTADYTVQVAPLTKCCCGRTKCGDPPWGICPDPADPEYPFYQWGDPYLLYVNSNPERPNDIYAFVGNPYLSHPGTSVEIFPIELDCEGKTVESVPLSYCVDKPRTAYTTFLIINVCDKKLRIKITQTAFGSHDELDLEPGWEYLKTFVDEVPVDPKCEPKVNKLIFQSHVWREDDPPLDQGGGE